MNFRIDFNISKKIVPTLEHVTDKQMYSIARKTLDATNQKVPRFKGFLRNSTSGFLGVGVVKLGNQNYEIGSAMDYASDVYMYPENTNWTTPGTNNQWFIRAWQQFGKNIVKIVLSKEKLK